MVDFRGNSWGEEGRHLASRFPDRLHEGDENEKSGINISEDKISNDLEVGGLHLLLEFFGDEEVHDKVNLGVSWFTAKDKCLAVEHFD